MSASLIQLPPLYVKWRRNAEKCYRKPKGECNTIVESVFLTTRYYFIRHWSLTFATAIFMRTFLRKSKNNIFYGNLSFPALKFFLCSKKNLIFRELSSRLRDFWQVSRQTNRIRLLLKFAKSLLKIPLLGSISFLRSAFSVTSISNSG